MSSAEIFTQHTIKALKVSDAQSIQWKGQDGMYHKI